MNLNDYQARAVSTDSFGDVAGHVSVAEMAFMTKVLGLVGESGEVAEKFKKILRNDGGIMNEDQRQELAKELGDVLWYIAVLSKYLNFDLEEIGERNLNKLMDRKDRGVITSKGDNR